MSLSFDRFIRIGQPARVPPANPPRPPGWGDNTAFAVTYNGLPVTYNGAPVTYRSGANG